MKTGMRTDNSKRNLVAGISVTLLMTLLGFFTRRVFVDSVGIEYLGLNGLLTNILAVVSLLEGGIGTSIVYNLYKPLAEGDRPRIIALVQLYRQLYRYIAAGIVAMGLAIYPFIDFFIKDGEGLRHVTLVFAIFLFNSVVPYLSAYRWGLINADQRAWRLAGINVAYQVGVSLAKGLCYGLGVPQIGVGSLDIGTMTREFVYWLRDKEEAGDTVYEADGVTKVVDSITYTNV